MPDAVFRNRLRSEASALTDDSRWRVGAVQLTVSVRPKPAHLGAEVDSQEEAVTHKCKLECLVGAG